jgi:hypothetical protein
MTKAQISLRLSLKFSIQNNISHPDLDPYRTEEQKATLIPVENKTKNDNDNGFMSL